jgi:hypothetical protein
MLYELSKQIEGHTICALGDGAAWPVQVGQSSNIVSYGHTICTVGMVGKNLNVILMELFFSRRDG